jgi:signal transduction histidine kinase
MDKRNLQLKKKLSFDPPFYGDRETLQTALSNVLENAVKFSPEKGTVTVRMRSADEGFDITVANTFEVVPDEDLLTIFEAFHRREGTEASGYGLGLAITKRIVEKHGGRIRAINGAEGFEIQIHLPNRRPEEGS